MLSLRPPPAEPPSLGGASRCLAAPASARPRPPRSAPAAVSITLRGRPAPLLCPSRPTDRPTDRLLVLWRSGTLNSWPVMALRLNSAGDDKWTVFHGAVLLRLGSPAGLFPTRPPLGLPEPYLSGRD